jgi:hypothetical protein
MVQNSLGMTVTHPRLRHVGGGDLRIKCKILDLRFQALPDDITACHSSLGGQFGERINSVKDASRKDARRLRRAFFRTPIGILDDIESTSPIMLGPLNE